VQAVDAGAIALCCEEPAQIPEKIRMARLAALAKLSDASTTA